jgi:hypothetical protein
MRTAAAVLARYADARREGAAAEAMTLAWVLGTRWPLQRRKQPTMRPEAEIRLRLQETQQWAAEAMDTLRTARARFRPSYVTAERWGDIDARNEKHAARCVREVATLEWVLGKRSDKTAARR